MQVLDCITLMHQETLKHTTVCWRQEDQKKEIGSGVQVLSETVTELRNMALLSHQLPIH